jgi:cell wall-associated NlpC family hydrolase
MYRSGPTSFLDVLLGATTFKDFATTWGVLNDINEDNAELIRKTRELKAQLEETRVVVLENEKLAKAKLQEAEEIKANAQAMVEECSSQIETLEDQIEELKRQQEEAARRAAEAAAAAAGRIAEYRPPDVKYEGDNPLIAAAYSQLGVPYVWGGTTPYAGLDCSGLTQYCYAQVGKSIPRTSSAQRSAGQYVALSDAQPGDILWKSGHVGIYIGNGNYIHAPYSGTVVQINSNMGMWVCAVRF